MLSNQNFLGCPCDVNELVQKVDDLNLKVVDQVNSSQELVMIKNYVQETNERIFLNTLKERVSEVASWHWVLQDLFNRMDDAIIALRYETNAVNVIVNRINNEIKERTLEGCRPGALCPRTDITEDAIMQEYKFLTAEKRKFEALSREIERQIKSLEKTKKRIENDITQKQEAMSIDEACGKTVECTSCGDRKKKKKKRKPIEQWIINCEKLKESGLNALRNAVTIRQQIRGARVQLSIAAQTFGARIDALLRKRLHANTAKLEEISFQKDEAQRDLRSLDEELAATEKSIQETIDQEQIVLKRLEDRSRRPLGELTKDDVERTLRGEQASLKHFRSKLRDNIQRINRLKEQIRKTISLLEDYATDIIEVMSLDQRRIQARLDGENQPLPEDSCSRGSNAKSHEKVDVRQTLEGAIQETTSGEVPQERSGPSRELPVDISNTRGSLHPIQEEEEDYEDDYPMNF